MVNGIELWLTDGAKGAREQLGQAEVPDLEYGDAAAVSLLRSVRSVPVVERKDVGRLEVSIKDAAGVDAGQPPGNLNGRIGRVVGKLRREEDYGRHRVGGVPPPDPVCQR